MSPRACTGSSLQPPQLTLDRSIGSGCSVIALACSKAKSSNRSCSACLIPRSHRFRRPSSSRPWTSWRVGWFAECSCARPRRTTTRWSPSSSRLRKSDRASAGDVIESYLAGQSSASRYWPDDAELREELGALAGLSSSWSWSASHGARGHRGSSARLEKRKVWSWRRASSQREACHRTCDAAGNGTAHWPLQDGPPRGRSGSHHSHAR